MAQFHSFRARLRFSRLEQQTLLLFLLFGSVFGAICARLYASEHLASAVGELGLQPFLRMWLRAALFPCLLAVALLLRRKALFRLLLFCKGFCTAYSLCVFVSFGWAGLSFFLSTVLFETLLPLPLYLLIGSAWAGQTEDTSPELWLLCPCLFASIFGVLLKTLLYSFC